MESKHSSAASIEVLETRIAPAAVAAISLADLNGSNGFKLSGASVDYSGRVVSAAGDVNGDGFDDFLVTAFRADEGGTGRGATYVIFGKAGGFDADVALSELNGTNGFKLSGADNDLAGISVSAAGDVNGDGFDDILIGAYAAKEGGVHRGAAYVIFGKADGFGASVALSGLNGTNGFKLSGVADGDYAGNTVSAAGDVNGDGFDDILVSALYADEGGTDRGAVYVVFGKPNGFGSSVALSGLNGSNGFKLSGLADNDFVGYSMNAAGDVNGDGFDDFIVGTYAPKEGGTLRGATYVIFGKAGGFGASVALSGLNGTNGFKLSGLEDYDYSGVAVSSAGDVNGDGFDDILIGASGAKEGGSSRGAAYVIFGKASGFGASVALSGLNGTNGFKLSGAANGDTAGSAVSAAGDVNGDGFDDILVGAFFADEGGTDRGAAYVVFGKADGFGASMTLSELNGSNGFKFSGRVDKGFAGVAVSAAGDVNGDGFDDVLIGTQGVGSAYVAFGFGTADVSVAANGKSATFTDWDGDLVTIKTTKGSLDATQFKLSSPNPLTGGAHLIYADFTTAGTGNEFIGANLAFTAKPGPKGGDGLVNVGTLDARGVALGKVSVDGDLQQLDAASVAGLTVYSLGQFADHDLHGAPLTSEIGGKLGALTVKTDISHVTLAAQTFGAIKALNLDSVSILASGTVNPAKIANALAIQSLTVNGSVHDSHILAGYDATGAPINADVQIGKVLVKGQWVASDLVAGVRAGNDGIFATGDANETLIPGGNSIVAKIASITINGTVIGTADNLRDGFGFAAEEIGALRIGKAKVPLQKGAHNDTAALILALTGDLRVVEMA